MLNTQDLDNFQLNIIQQLINMNSQNMWQKVASLIADTQSNANHLANRVTFVKEKTDVQEIIQKRNKTDLSKVLGVLPNNEPLQSWLKEIE